MLAAKLRPSNVDPASGALEELQRVIKQIRQRWGNVRILVRSAYSRVRWTYLNLSGRIFRLFATYRHLQLDGLTNLDRFVAGGRYHGLV